MSGYKDVQRRGMWILLVVSFVLGGMGALSCQACEEMAHAQQEATITIDRAAYLQLTNRLITLEEERNLARSEVKRLSVLLETQRTKADKLLQVERNKCASQLANERILQAKQKQACARCPDCTGWKVGTGIGAGALAVCAAVCAAREVARSCP